MQCARTRVLLAADWVGFPHETARHTYSKYTAVFASNVSVSTRSQAHTVESHYQHSVSYHVLTVGSVPQLTQYTSTHYTNYFKYIQCGVQQKIDRFRHDRGSCAQFRICSLTRPQNRVRSRGRPAKECATHIHGHVRTRAHSLRLTRRYASLQSKREQRVLKINALRRDDGY